MAEYTFTGASPRMLFGLAQGINATLVPATPDSEPLADGQTIVVHPGDRLTTDEDYVHAELEPVVPDNPPADPPATTTKTARKKA
jgi:hypothetical protein